jgi:hypothetical protein
VVLARKPQEETMHVQRMGTVTVARGKNMPENVRGIVGTNLRAPRKYAQPCQRDSRDNADIGQSHLSQCEAGRWDVGIDDIARVVKIMGSRPHDLLDLKFHLPFLDRFVLKNIRSCGNWAAHWDLA